jgi:predicted NBD/HSP70 family sugar kinase
MARMGVAGAVLGVDLGGRKTAVGLVDAEGEEREKRRAPAEKWRPEATVAQAAELAGAALAAASGTWEDIAGAGICVPGTCCWRA